MLCECKGGGAHSPHASSKSASVNVLIYLLAWPTYCTSRLSIFQQSTPTSIEWTMVAKS